MRDKTVNPEKSFVSSVSTKEQQNRAPIKKEWYNCSECTKSFTTLIRLNFHLRVHTEEKPYSCPECTKSFSTSNKLVIHRKLHAGEKPLKCQQCNKSFSMSHELKEHMKVHAGGKPRPSKRRTNLQYIGVFILERNHSSA